MSKRIFELAVPKGNISDICEICGNKATTKCEVCRVTHYCSKDHKYIDSISFHKKVCSKLAEIRKEQPIPFSETDRINAAETLLSDKQEILKLAESVSKKWLLERKPTNAYPSAMIAWNMARDLRSHDSIEVINPTCLVSEMFLNLGDLKAAEQYMIQASWIAQKYDILPPVIFSQLYRLRGLVFMAVENWKQALECFSEYVFAVAHEFGVADVRLGIPYGLFGLALLKSNKVEGALSSFHKMVDKWLNHLLTQYEEKSMRAATEVALASDEKIQELEFQYMEAKIVFEWTYENIRELGMNQTTDLINFKILCFQFLCKIRENNSKEAVVYKEEALAIALRTKQDKSLSIKAIKLLSEVLGENFLDLWERKNNRPRTVATKYLEMIKAINV